MVGGCDGITAGVQSDVPAVEVIRLCDEQGLLPPWPRLIRAWERVNWDTSVPAVGYKCHVSVL